MMGYSSDMPFPPNISLDCLAISNALPVEFLFINEINSGAKQCPFAYQQA